MPTYTFEIVRRGELPVVAAVAAYPSFAEAWCTVERIAFGMRKTDSESYIRVKDERGRIIARAGVMTARASYQICNRANCPLKPRIE